MIKQLTIPLTNKEHGMTAQLRQHDRIAVARHEQYQEQVNERIESERERLDLYLKAGFAIILQEQYETNRHTNLLILVSHPSTVVKQYVVKEKSQVNAMPKGNELFFDDIDDAYAHAREIATETRESVYVVSNEDFIEVEPDMIPQTLLVTSYDSVSHTFKVFLDRRELLDPVKSRYEQISVEWSLVAEAKLEAPYQYHELIKTSERVMLVHNHKVIVDYKLPDESEEGTQSESDS